MTKKHFIALADAIKQLQTSPFNEPFTDYQIARLADFLQSTNPRFNRSRWIGYIKGENGKNGGKVRAA